MSAFLGKIHYWLYNKIILQEKLIVEITELAGKKGFDTKSLLRESSLRYGAPVTGELEDIIEHSNIHGWLQEQITSAENRLAYTVTELIQNNIATIEEFSGLFFQDGQQKGRELGDLGAAENYYQLIFDFMLEGMPCDRVNNIISSTEQEMIWETTRDLHAVYWEKAGGDAKNFNKMRIAWIQGFLSEKNFEYTLSEDGINQLRKV